jgi:S1-C subfamily serine protease
VALVVAAAAVMVADTGEDSTSAVTTSFPFAQTAPTTEPGSGSVADDARVDAVVAAVRPSTVVLRVVQSGKATTVMGLVVESGGILVTTARVVIGATRITAVEPDGSRQSAGLIGIDRQSDLAVLRISDDLPPATFNNDDPATGVVAMALSMRPRPKSEPTPLIYAGTVMSSGTAVAGNSATDLFATTSVRTPLERSDLGCPLVDDQGHVVGMLELTDRMGSSQVAEFLPAALVAGVARQLVSSGQVDHGWAGFEGSTTPAPSTLATATATSTPPHLTGALLDSVVRDSPAAVAGLAAGDVVVAVDGAPVHSMSELMTRLYPDPPGTSVAVTFERSQTTETVEVQLADPDTDSTGSTSPSSP